MQKIGLKQVVILRTKIEEILFFYKKNKRNLFSTIYDITAATDMHMRETESDAKSYCQFTRPADIFH